VLVVLREGVPVSSVELSKAVALTSEHCCVVGRRTSFISSFLRLFPSTRSTASNDDVCDPRSTTLIYNRSGRYPSSRSRNLHSRRAGLRRFGGRVVEGRRGTHAFLTRTNRQGGSPLPLQVISVKGKADTAAIPEPNSIVRPSLPCSGLSELIDISYRSSEPSPVSPACRQPSPSSQSTAVLVDPISPESFALRMCGKQRRILSRCVVSSSRPAGRRNLTLFAVRTDLELFPTGRRCEGEGRASILFFHDSFPTLI
jgi:hypothetical protein